MNSLGDEVMEVESQLKESRSRLSAGVLLILRLASLGLDLPPEVFAVRGWGFTSVQNFGGFGVRGFVGVFWFCSREQNGRFITNINIL